MRVLLTTDGSKDAVAAMRAAGRLLKSEDRQVDVLYVANLPRVLKSAQIDKQAYQHRITEETKRILHEAKKVLLEEGLDVVTLCQTGSPASVIMREAADYDLTVIGAKGRNVSADVGLGPVASRLVEHASASVLVGREPPGDKGIRILAPVDGSEGSQNALDALDSFIDLESAEVTLLHVLETLWLPHEDEAEPLEETDPDHRQNDQWKAELRREADQFLTEARFRVLPHHPGVTTLVREGNPANEILSEADQGGYDLVVVGATSATDMRHSVLGSVSSKVAWNAPCSVLVVRVAE